MPTHNKVIKSSDLVSIKDIMNSLLIFFFFLGEMRGNRSKPFGVPIELTVGSLLHWRWQAPQSADTGPCPSAIFFPCPWTVSSLDYKGEGEPQCSAQELAHSQCLIIALHCRVHCIALSKALGNTFSPTVR